MEKWSRHQETLTPVHSTPKRSSLKVSGTQEQADNHMSPSLLPCTQEGGNEVAWDWQSPLAKSATCHRSRTNNENVGTPKRKTLLHKKRNSNSPLLYKPSKRKFMQNDNQQECVEIFTAEMKALSEQIKTVPKEEENQVGRIETEGKSDGGEDELLIDMDIEDFGECESKLVPQKEVAKTLWKKPESPVGKTSLDDLFDESIEDCMVKCSQEVEEKLRLESRFETSKTNPSGGNDSLKDFSWHQHSYKSFVASKEKPYKTNQVLSSSRSTDGKHAKTESVKSDGSKSTMKESQTACSSSTKAKSSSTECEKSKATIEKCGNSPQSSRLNSNKETASVSRTNNTVVTKQSEIFEIPDDSFDEDFLDVCFDDVENTTAERTSGLNQSSNRYGKCYSSPHLNAPSDTASTAKFVGIASRKLLLPPPGETPTNNSRLKNDPNLFPRTSSNESFESRSTSVQQSQSSATNVSRKFFKTKSFSSSNFDDRSVDRSQFPSTTTVTNSVTLHTTNGKNGKSNFCLKRSSVSTEQQQQQQQRQQQQHTKSTDKYSDNAWPRTNGEHNNGIKHFNRNASKDDGNRLNIISEGAQKPHNGVKDGTTGSQLTQICTPEEIERKRREAKMKLEIKRKLQARSKSAGILTDFTTNKAPFPKR